MPPKRPARPDTSPLVEIYAGWEQTVQAALLGHWQQQSQKLALALNAIKAVQDIEKDADLWSGWTAAYLALMLPHIGTAADIGADAGAAILQSTWTIGVDADIYSPTVADWARRHAGRLAKGLTRTDKLMLRRHLSAWADAEEDFPALITRINSFLNNEARARKIGTTEATECYANGNIEAWRASEVVTGKIWETANDELVCPICGGLAGQLSELDGQEWMHLRKQDLSIGLSVKNPPAHPN